ncbi:hypothetical protein PG996_008294 [Apiospora saccharicola]|uniref:Uncharacterized protein n=1 Tax=Apiospora saccharicola TaxID=335842 RepID=A0ABR1UXH5_9PEZI
MPSITATEATTTMFPWKRIQYTALEDGEKSPARNSSCGCFLSKGWAARHSETLVIANVVLVALSTVLLFVFVGVIYQDRSGSRCSMREAGVNDNVLGLELPVSSTQVEGDFGNDDNYKTSVYRGPPGPETDAAWARVANSEMIVVSTADIVRLGKDPATTVRAPAAWGLGPDAHLGVLDVFHQVHCLNALRRGIYYEHYFAPALGANKTEVFYNHMGHCMSILLQNIMCAASLDVITHSECFLSSIQHQCRDIEAVVEWQEKNKVDYEIWSTMKAPEGANMLEPSPALLQAFQAIASAHGNNTAIPF